jgi:septal ring factor EnvC (AmiA/AmiB activator)
LCIIGSSWETGQLKTELSEVKAEIAKLEEQIKKMHHLRMELDVMYEDEKTRLIKQQDRDRERVRLIIKRNYLLFTNTSRLALALLPSQAFIMGGVQKSR